VHTIVCDVSKTPPRIIIFKSGVRVSVSGSSRAVFTGTEQECLDEIERLGAVYPEPEES